MTLLFAERFFSTRTPIGIQVAEDWTQFLGYMQELLGREQDNDYASSYDRVFEEYLPYAVLFGKCEMNSQYLFLCRT